MLALLGLMALSRVSGGFVWRGLLALGLGLAFATVGTDIVAGRSRFTFGNVPLSQGIEIVPVAVGLYGLAEVLIVAERSGGVVSVLGVKFRELFPSLAEWKRAMPPIFRGTFLGFASVYLRAIWCDLNLHVLSPGATAFQAPRNLDMVQLKAGRTRRPTMPPPAATWSRSLRWGSDSARPWPCC